ncbi:MAG: hypothetical protein ACRD15_20595, partial [Vicinamibacterales bacterium]
GKSLGRGAAREDPRDPVSSIRRWFRSALWRQAVAYLLGNGNVDECIVRMLLAAGADPAIRDSKHGGDAIGRAQFFQQPEIVTIVERHRT